MDKTAATTVMGNRISWSKFYSIRKQALCDEVKKTDGTDTQNPPKKHGCKPEALCVDKENLLTILVPYTKYKLVRTCQKIWVKQKEWWAVYKRISEATQHSLSILRSNTKSKST